MSLDLLPARETRTREAVAATSPRRDLSDALRNSRVAPLVAVALLVLASLWLRTRALHFHYWVDEGLSVGIAQHPLSQIPTLLREDGSPPLYYLLLHFWMQWRGSSEVATHELSLIPSLLAVVVAYWAGSSILDRRSGLICAVLAAMVPYLTYYGQETRMYSLVALLSLIVATSFIHVFVNRRRGYIPLFVVSLTAALYTHNWALFLALMSAVAFLVVLLWGRSPRRELCRDGAICLAGVAVLYAPWLPTVVYQARHTGAPWAAAPVLWSLSQGSYWLVGGRGAAIALLLGGGVGLVAAGGLRATDRRLALVIRCLFVLGVGTVLLAWVYSHLTPAWAPRYLAVVVGPLIVLFGVGLGRSSRLGLIALALACSFWVLDPLPTSLNSKSNVATAMARIAPDLTPGTVVLSTQPEQVPTIAYYLHDRPFRYVTPLGPVADPRVVDWRGALARFRSSSVASVLTPVVNRLQPGQRLLLVMPTQTPTTPRWMGLIDRSTKRWADALADDRALSPIARTGVSPYAPGVAVRTALYERR